jgi:hypothetical protein
LFGGYGGEEGERFGKVERRGFEEERRREWKDG